MLCWLRHYLGQNRAQTRKEIILRNRLFKTSSIKPKLQFTALQSPIHCKVTKHVMARITAKIVVRSHKSKSKNFSSKETSIQSTASTSMFQFCSYVCATLLQKEIKSSVCWDFNLCKNANSAWVLAKIASETFTEFFFQFARHFASTNRLLSSRTYGCNRNCFIV